jgi:hypothetical protein
VKKNSIKLRRSPTTAFYFHIRMRNHNRFKFGLGRTHNHYTAMRNIFLTVFIIFAAGCSTKYYQYSGGVPIIGKGGASQNIDSIDLWIDGSPPRRFRVIGVILDGRPGRGIAMALRNKQVASVAKKQGGDAVLFSFDESEYIGSINSSNAFSTVNLTTAGATSFGQAFASSASTGVGFSQPMFRRNSKFYVIKYL